MTADRDAPPPVATGPDLRPATARDVETIARIWHDGWRDGHLGHTPEALVAHRTPASFVPRTADRIGRTTVAEVDGQVAGFVTVIDDEAEQVYVDARFRGRGVAEVLLRHAEQVVATSYDTVWLVVATGNARARRFYERSGWHDAGPIAYEAEVTDGVVAVPCRRYERHLGAGDGPVVV